jgi:hypothetical protein
MSSLSERTWSNIILRTERHGDRIIPHSRPAGAPGPQGPPGARPPTYLAGGAAGANGSSQVKVLRRDGTEATYPTRYELKVVSFDVVDENQDGINEPGEHLFVKNVRVENTGGMPSPKSSEIQVLIHGTHWLDPIASEPIFLPRDIPPGATVEVPGVLRAFILQERAPRKPGQLLYASDGIQLIATATQLQRTLPDFSGSTQITIRYPLELGAPRYLDCVEKGDEVTFSWVVRIALHCLHCRSLTYHSYEMSLLSRMALMASLKGPPAPLLPTPGISSMVPTPPRATNTK